MNILKKWWFWIVTIIIILGILYFWSSQVTNCQPIGGWAKNDETGMCRYFPNSCAIERGYSGVNVLECDCDNLEPYSLDIGVSECKGNQELYNT